MIDAVFTLLQAALAEPLWPAAAAIVLCAGVVKGLTGFGSALVMMPVLSVIYGPAAAVATMQLIDGPLAWTMLPGAARRCDWRRVLVLAGGAAVGMPLGVIVLRLADPEYLRAAIALTVLIMAGLLASGWRYRGRPGTALSGGTGLAAGLLGGSTGIGGPPVVLFWLGSQADGASVRANLIVYFAVGTISGLISLTAAGLVTGAVVGAAISLAPLFALGMWLGAKGFRLATETVFRRAALTLVAASGVSGLML
ncbi:MAG: sulfite exporter TauE/SafE family protein [Marivibrio sp.]|uniref:sulfite exporter TauE/SafE family protein n=1 Tax=Marivibrio sp. TaxID=2039719 RepID=UPI0032ED8474